MIIGIRKLRKCIQKDTFYSYMFTNVYRVSIICVGIEKTLGFKDTRPRAGSKTGRLMSTSSITRFKGIREVFQELPSKVE